MNDNKPTEEPNLFHILSEGMFRVQIPFPSVQYVTADYRVEPGEWQYSFNWRKLWLLLSLIFYPLLTFTGLMAGITVLIYFGVGEFGFVLGMMAGVLTVLVGIGRHDLYSNESWRNSEWVKLPTKPKPAPSPVSVS